MSHTLEERCRQLMIQRKFEQCQKEIETAIAENPHCAIPHNLMGILLEKESNHVLAMKHFRAAYALDPRITENNDIITDFQADKLMEKILSNDNLNQAYKKVKSNKGAGGVDGMSVDELLSFLRDNGMQLKQHRFRFACKYRRRTDDSM